jgi:hypothetical protein
MSRARLLLALLPLCVLGACAQQQADVVVAGSPGFIAGLWHGLIFPVAWILSLFMPDVAIYAVPNNGGWYDFGYFLGIMAFGAGAGGGHKVVRTRVIRERIVPGTSQVVREEYEE